MVNTIRSDLLFSNDRPGVYPDSWYVASSYIRTSYPSLTDTTKFDVAIIGAGFTGLSAATHLSAGGYRVAVVDAHRVGWGASGRNGGQLGSGQRVDQQQLEHRYGRQSAELLWQLAQDSKALVRSLIDTYGIACDYRAGIINADHNKGFDQSTRQYVELLQDRYSYSDIEYIARDELAAVLGTPCYHGGTIDRGAGHLHPLKFALGLADAIVDNGGEIFESTTVQKIRSVGDTVEVTTPAGKLIASKLLLACNGYLGGLQHEVAAKVMPINNYIIATQPLNDELYESILTNDMAVADSRFVVNYFRKSADRRLLFGGRESYGYRFPADINSFVRKAMLKVYPQLNNIGVDYGWGGTLAITMNRMPHVGEVRPSIYSASGYSGHGVGMATLSGKLVADAIDGAMQGFNVLSAIKHRKFPGGSALRSPLLKIGMLYYALRDRL